MIRVKNLWKKYNSHAVLKGLDLEVSRGETVVILGRSGVGKSVLLRQLIGIDKPDRGTIEIEGKLISSLTGSDLYLATRHMGMLFQASALFDSMNVFDNTAFYLNEHGDPETGKKLPQKEVKARVKKALEMVGLADTQAIMPADLSGGMRKRAAIARLIVYHPRILLYDEPTTGLDPITSMQINELIVQIQNELNATSIVVTHDICSAFHVGNRIALHHDGKIAYITSKEEFPHINDPLVQAFLKNAIPEVNQNS